MSFVVKGGYDAIRKQVMNISLKRTEKWTSGSLFVKKNILVYNLVPRYDNKIEVVKYNNNHALLLNNTIIYEDKKLFGNEEIRCKPDKSNTKNMKFANYDKLDANGIIKENTLLVEDII